MTAIEPLRTAPRFRDERIDMAHGAGGRASRRLVEGLIVPRLGGGGAALGDAAHVAIGGALTAFTTDTFVVRPLRFPGGSIGELAVNGTVNDLAVSGARPVALLVGLVIEAGLAAETLAAEVDAIAAAAARAGVRVVGGDTKVVEHGKADGLYVNTSGLGRVDGRLSLSPGAVHPGDRVIVTGPIGDHGVTILLARGELALESEVRSDTRPVWPFVEALATRVPWAVRWMRDPTRGGVASALNELALDCGLAVALDEESIPVRDGVRGACELLGLDPLHIANEGQLVAVVAPEAAGAAVEALRACPGGGEAAVIGTIRGTPAATVTATASYGGSRIVDMLVGDPLPRIC